MLFIVMKIIFSVSEAIHFISLMGVWVEPDGTNLELIAPKGPFRRE
ncbi:hypothetical protein [Bacillus wiedmannii]